jgi:tetrapyrrole methylase family protein/MazG family protein
MNKDQLAKALSALSDLVSRLRGPEGCPWDREQTDSSIKMYLLEEAYEVLDAIENGSPEGVCEELGDLLFQIIFLASLAEVRGEFDLTEVMEKIASKMIRRHPHVFGDVQVKNPAEVSKNWEEIKKTEKGASDAVTPLLERVPIDLPALMRAHRLSARALQSNIVQKNEANPWEQAQAEFDDLQGAIAEEDKERIRILVGDLLFSLANLARHFGFNAEDALRGANNKFIESHTP